MADNPAAENPTTAHYTPGPWVYDLRQDMYPAVKIGNEWQRIYVPAPLHHVHECEANARLIAAAPELLAALKAINDWAGTEAGYQALPFEPPWAAQMYAAIARAEGRRP